MRMFSIFCASIAFLAFAGSASAWLRPRYEDADVMARSELIVVGAIKADTLQYISHTDAQGATSWEHHATLLVREVLKGKCAEKEIPVVIHYGLEPLVGGHSKHDGHEINLPTTGPAAAITIIDDGSSAVSFEPLVADARDDNIWCLRRGGGVYGWEPGKGNLGVIDPEDLQPLGLKDYLCCYLAKDPELAVRNQMQKQPAIADRALRYLQHMEVQRILLEPDASQRVERLLPYFQSRSTWGYRDEAGAGIVAAGPVAGPYLMGIYQQSWESNKRQEIIIMWGQIKYTGCTDLLIELLKKEEDYWSQQKLPPGWWNAENPSREQWRDHYGQVYSAVYALDQIHDPRARDAIELTLKRWERIKFDNPQIVQECETALKAFGK